MATDEANNATLETDPALGNKTPTSSDSEQATEDFGKKAGAPIESIMTKNVISISPAAKIEEAFDLVKKHRLSQLPVVSGEKYMGMISDIDIYHVKSIFSGTSSEQPRDKSLLSVKIETIMRRSNIPPTTRDRTIGEVVGLMRKHDLQAVAITDANAHIAGIVTYADILAYMEENQLFK